MAEEKPGGEAAEEPLQERKSALPEKNVGLLVLQKKKMYLAAVPLMGRLWGKCFNYFRALIRS